MSTRGPFRGSRARAVGARTAATLRSDCVRVLPDVYVDRSTELDATTRDLAALCWAVGGALTGWSAASILGAQWVPDHVAELALPTHVRRPTSGALVHQVQLRPDVTEEVDGVVVTTAARTAYDLGRRLPLVDAVAAVDQLCWVGICGPAEVAAVAAHHPGARGLVRLRHVLELVDPGAESPQESALRVLLVTSGLPRPRTQVKVFDPRGRLTARCDLGWERWRVVAEYDGAHHRSGRQFTGAVDRYEALDQLGWTVVRVTGTHLIQRPQQVVARTAAALRRAGARW